MSRQNYNDLTGTSRRNYPYTYNIYVCMCMCVRIKCMDAHTQYWIYGCNFVTRASSVASYCVAVDYKNNITICPFGFKWPSLSKLFYTTTNFLLQKSKI